MDSCEIKNILNLADAYLTSAIHLSIDCINDNADKKADILIFPILANTNHGLELYIKGITLILNGLLENNKKIEGTHNLKQLFNTLKARIKELDGQRILNQFVKDFIELSEYIDELFEKIKSTPKNDKMDFSRYPTTKQYENHFYVDTFTNIEIDLENLINRLNIMYSKLESFSEYLLFERLLESD